LAHTSARKPGEIAMLTILQLKGLSILLKRLMVGNGLTCEEVQAMQPQGHRVMVSANNSTEVNGLSGILGTLGVTASNWREKLKPAFLAMMQVALHDSTVPLAKVLGGQQVWEPTTDYAPALNALADLPEWRTDAQFLRGSGLVSKDAVKYKDLSPPNKLAHDAMLETLLQGFDHYRLPEKATSKFPVSPNTPKLELGGDGDLVLVKPAANNIHAEQSLLLAYLNHLAMGGLPADVYIAGCKLPCDKCVKMIHELDAAFHYAHKTDLVYDSKSKRKHKNNSPTKYIAAPENPRTHVQYTRFLNVFRAPKE
jgi:hypothetical protein